MCILFVYIFFLGLEVHTCVCIYQEGHDYMCICKTPYARDVFVQKQMRKPAFVSYVHIWHTTQR
jgi:hypothetical protein